MPPSNWSDPASEELLGLAVDVLAAGDPRGGTLLLDVLTRECGHDFARTVRAALAGGAPPAAFDFLPEPSGRLAGARAAPPGAPGAETAQPTPAATAAGEDPAGPPEPPAGAAGPARRPARRPTPTPRALPTSGYVTAADVAAHFGVSSKAVYRWMATGRIRSERRPGGSYRIPADQFRAQ